MTTDRHLITGTFSMEQTIKLNTKHRFQFITISNAHCLPDLLEKDKKRVLRRSFHVWEEDLEIWGFRSFVAIWRESWSWSWTAFRGREKM